MTTWKILPDVSPDEHARIPREITNAFHMGDEYLGKVAADRAALFHKRNVVVPRGELPEAVRGKGGWIEVMGRSYWYKEGDIEQVRETALTYLALVGFLEQEAAEEKAKAEEEAKAAYAQLDYEALELFNIGNDDNLTEWPKDSISQDKYRRIALKARELHGKRAGE